MRNLVSTDWLANNLENVRIFDGSWHLPSANRDSYDEFKSSHIKYANFFDIDKYSDQKSDLPHMLPKKNRWEKIISELGVKNSDHIIIYDNSDVISSCRVWYTFLYFNHDPNLVSVLDGGLKKWLNESKEITRDIKIFKKSSYLAQENKSLVLSKEQIVDNIKDESFELIDARVTEILRKRDKNKLFVPRNRQQHQASEGISVVWRFRGGGRVCVVALYLR